MQDTKPTSPTLQGEIKATAELSLNQHSQMLELFKRHFGGVTEKSFAKDLSEKEAVVLLKDSGGNIRGFSSLMLLRAKVEGKNLAAFYSGDTIVDPEFWGYSALSRVWGRYVFAEAEALKMRGEADAVYWLLISSGYKTYRFLPMFYQQFYPSYDAPTPPHIQAIMHELARQKFGDEYNSQSGIVRFKKATPLKEGVAELNPKRLKDPHIVFFLKANPGHAQGDELVCLTELSYDNWTPAGRKVAGLKNSR